MYIVDLFTVSAMALLWRRQSRAWTKEEGDANHPFYHLRRQIQNTQASLSQ